MTKTVTCFSLLFLFRLISWVCSYCQISCSRMCVLKMTARTTQRIKRYTLPMWEEMTPLLCALRKSRNVVFSTPRCMSPKRVLQHTYMDTFKGSHRRRKRFPRWLSDKESTSQAASMGLIPGSGRSPGEENGNPLQYSCLENPMDRGAWQL